MQGVLNWRWTLNAIYLNSWKKNLWGVAQYTFPQYNERLSEICQAVNRHLFDFYAIILAATTVKKLCTGAIVVFTFYLTAPAECARYTIQ